LATVKFNSGENYPVATLADYPVANHQYIFTVGYPKLGQTPSWRFTIGQIFSRENGLLALTSTGQDLKSIDNTIQDANLGKEYELVYTSITLGGMSGGPVVDSQGRVIGIHGKAEGQVLMEDTTRVQLGYSLGIPISTFLRIAPELNTRVNRVENTPAPQLKSWEIESIRKAILSVDVSGGNASAIEWIERGNQLWLLGRYQEAATAFENAIEQRPAFIHLAYYGKGLSLWWNGNDTAAVEALKQVVQAKPDFVPAWYFLSLTNQNLGNLDQALFNVRQAIFHQNQAKYQPISPNLYALKGNLLSDLKRYKEAIEAIDQAILVDPRAIFYVIRGDIHNNLGDKQEAMNDYTQALDLNPNVAYTYTARGSVRKELGDNKGAIDDYTQALRLNSDGVVIWDIRNGK
jgi:tetratricopeptide (TPR) repeat protein